MKLTVDGKIYRLAPMDLQMAAKVFELINAREKSPFAELIGVLKDLPANLQEEFARDAWAAQKARKPVNSVQDPRFSEALGDPAIALQVVCLTWQRHQPELSDDQAWALHLAAISEHGEDYLARAEPEGDADKVYLQAVKTRKKK